MNTAVRFAIVLSILAILHAASIKAQNPPSVSDAPVSSSNSAPPARVLECEAKDDACDQPNALYNSTWEFTGGEGTAKWPGVVAGTRLTIEKFDGQTLTVRRFDKAGATSGLSAIYTGKIEGNRVSGTVKWSWLGHPGFPASGEWAGMLEFSPADTAGAPAPQPDSEGIPAKLLECESTGPCNGAWTFTGTEGRATWFAQKNVRAKLTIVRSAPDDIMIRRTDTSGGGMTAVYIGKRHGNQLSGTVVWSSPGHPGGNSGNWSATVPEINCAGNPNLSLQDALRIGQDALMFHSQSDALSCYIVAAQTGDIYSEMLVGMIFYQGGDSSVPQDYRQALVWLEKAANQGNFQAQKLVADMYELGKGTARNPELYHFYLDKANEQQRQQERREDRAAAQANAQANMLGGFIAGAVFGALLF